MSNAVQPSPWKPNISNDLNSYRPSLLSHMFTLFVDIRYALSVVLCTVGERGVQAGADFPRRRPQLKLRQMWRLPQDAPQRGESIPLFLSIGHQFCDYCNHTWGISKATLLNFITQTLTDKQRPPTRRKPSIMKSARQHRIQSTRHASVSIFSFAHFMDFAEI